MCIENHSWRPVAIVFFVRYDYLIPVGCYLCNEHVFRNLSLESILVTAGE